jgi:hypothetical protein
MKIIRIIIRIITRIIRTIIRKTRIIIRILG